MKKTHPRRILDTLAKSNRDTLFPIFNKKTARRRYRSSNNTYLDNSVMRTARRLTEHGVLKRISPGQFTLSKKGMKLIK